MPDTATQIRDYYRAIAIRVEPEEILEPWTALSPEPPPSPRRLRGPVMAFGVLVILVALIAFAAYLLPSTDPVIEELEPTTTVAPTTVVPTTIPGALPSFVPSDLPPFRATVRYADADVPQGEFTAEVVYSYGGNGQFRRQIASVNVPEFHWGQPGDYYVTDGASTAHFYEGRFIGGPEGAVTDLLGPLFWTGGLDNWDQTCRGSDFEILPTQQIAGRQAIHARCSTLADDWELWVDAATGLVLKAEGEIPGGDFTIGEAFEVVTVDYAPVFEPGVFDIPATEPPGPPIPVVEGSIYFVTSDSYHESVSESGFESQVVQAVWYLDENTWRKEVLDASVGFPQPPGTFTVWANGQAFEHRPDNNLWEMDTASRSPLEVFPSSDCNDTGRCVVWGEGLTGCEVNPGELLIGRSATRYSCVRLNPDSPDPDLFEIWIDADTGLTLRLETSSQNGLETSSFEVLEIDFEPSFTSDLFEQSCPTSDCQSAEEVSKDPWSWVTLKQGEVAPSWTGDLIGGGRFDLASLPARPAIFYFWYDYCCLEELAEFQELADSWSDRVEFVAVVLAGDGETAARILDRGAFTFPMVTDLENDASGLPEIEDIWGVDGVPLWVVLDSDRNAATVLIWDSTRADREAALAGVTG